MQEFVCKLPLAFSNKNHYNYFYNRKIKIYIKNKNKGDDIMSTKNKTLFYGRISTKHQNEQLQLDAFEKYYKENDIKDYRIFIDKQTGTNKNRPKLISMLDYIREGDLVVIWALDRLSRNYKECRELWSEITEKGADIFVITMPILDTRQHKDLLGNFISDLILSVLGYVSQQETEMRKSRAKAGYEAMLIDETTGKRYSRKTGNSVGRATIEPPKDFEKIMLLQQNKQLSQKDALQILGLTKSTYYKLVKDYKNKK